MRFLLPVAAALILAGLSACGGDGEAARTLPTDATLPTVTRSTPTVTRPETTAPTETETETEAAPPTEPEPTTTIVETEPPPTTVRTVTATI